MFEAIPQRTSILQGHIYIKEVLTEPNEKTCYEVFHLKIPTFILVDTLKNKGLIEDTKGVRVDKTLAIFLYIVARPTGMRRILD